MTRKSFLALCSALFLPWRKNKERGLDIGIVESATLTWLQWTDPNTFFYFDRGNAVYVNEGQYLWLPKGSHLKRNRYGNWELIHS